MQTAGFFACAYLLIGMLISLLMDRFNKLETWVFIIGVLTWPLLLPAAIVSGVKDMRRRRR